MADPARQASLEALERRCRELGTPLTIQRRATLAALVARADHPTADDLYEDVAGTLVGVSRGTVYRTLDTLVELGVIGRVCHPGSSARYDAKTHRHHHLVCDRCGSMADLEAPSLDAVEVPDLSTTGFSVRDYSVQFRGLCRVCAEGERASSRPRS